MTIKVLQLKEDEFMGTGGRLSKIQDFRNPDDWKDMELPEAQESDIQDILKYLSFDFGIFFINLESQHVRMRLGQSGARLDWWVHDWITEDLEERHLRKEKQILIPERTKIAAIVKTDEDGDFICLDRGIRIQEGETHISNFDPRILAIMQEVKKNMFSTKEQAVEENSNKNRRLIPKGKGRRRRR